MSSFIFLLPFLSFSYWDLSKSKSSIFPCWWKGDPFCLVQTFLALQYQRSTPVLQLVSDAGKHQILYRLPIIPVGHFPFYTSNILRLFILYLSLTVPLQSSSTEMLPGFSSGCSSLSQPPLNHLVYLRPFLQLTKITLYLMLLPNLSANPSGLESSTSWTTAFTIPLKHYLLSFGDLANFMTTIQKTEWFIEICKQYNKYHHWCLWCWVLKNSFTHIDTHTEYLAKGWQSDF